MEEFESNDPRDARVWELLGRARSVEASPYFHRKVMRAIQSEAPEPGGWRLVLRWLVPAAACGALAVMALAGALPHSAGAPSVAEADFDTIEGLDLLIADYESSLWLENTLSSVSR